MNIIVAIALLAIAAALGRLVRQMADLQTQVTHVASELSLESSATRLYLGRLGGDPGLQDRPAIDAGTFGAQG